MISFFKDVPASWAVITGILRLGATPFLVSPRNAVPAVAHLLRKSNCRTVVSSPDAAVLDLVQSALRLMEVDYKIPVVYIPLYDELYLDEGAPFERLPPYEITDMDTPGFMLHSSGKGLPGIHLDTSCSPGSVGSTAFPKLVVSSHQTLFHWSLIPCQHSHSIPVPFSLTSYMCLDFGDKDLCGYICGSHSLPLFRQYSRLAQYHH